MKCEVVYATAGMNAGCEEQKLWKLYILSKKHDSNLGFPETMIQN